MRRPAEIPEPLINRYAALLATRPKASELDMPLNLFVPSVDVYLSYLAETREVPASELDMAEFFSAGLLVFARWMQKYGYWGRWGHTVNANSYMLEFPVAQTSLLWIPKNACTSVKAMLAALEPVERQERLSSNRFHESVQAEFGIGLLRFGRDRFQPAFTLVRHPLERLVSCYIDKIVRPTRNEGRFEGFIPNHIRRAQEQLGLEEADLGRALSFSEFARYVVESSPWMLDWHWRPQSDFVCGLERRGLKLFRSDQLDRVSEWIEAPLQQTRRNASSGKTFDPAGRMTGLFADTLPRDIDLAAVKSYNQFFDDTLHETVHAFYRDDLRLYEAAGTAQESAAV